MCFARDDDTTGILGIHLQGFVSRECVHGLPGVTSYIRTSFMCCASAQAAEEYPVHKCGKLLLRASVL